MQRENKNHLKKGSFPIAEGKSFWFWQKGRALKFGSDELGFPLVVKPRGGSVARHVTTNIRSREELREGLDKAIVYSPAFIVERFIENSFVYRATVVDFDFVAVVKQVPANVVGDGTSTIQQLVGKKNGDKKRGEPHQKILPCTKSLLTKLQRKLLAEKITNWKLCRKRRDCISAEKSIFEIRRRPC